MNLFFLLARSPAPGLLYFLLSGLKAFISPGLVESLSFAFMVSYYREMAAFSFEAKPR